MNVIRSGRRRLQEQVNVFGNQLCIDHMVNMVNTDHFISRSERVPYLKFL